MGRSGSILCCDSRSGLAPLEEMPPPSQREKGDGAGRRAVGPSDQDLRPALEPPFHQPWHRRANPQSAPLGGVNHSPSAIPNAPCPPRCRGTCCWCGRRCDVPFDHEGLCWDGCGTGNDVLRAVNVAESAAVRGSTHAFVHVAGSAAEAAWGQLLRLPSS